MGISRHNVNFNKTFSHFKELMNRIFMYIGIQNVRLMDVYHDVYSLCNAQPVDFTEELFAGIVAYLGEFTEAICRELVQSSQLLENYARAWKRYINSCDALDNACEFLNKQIERRRAAISGNNRPSLSLIGEAAPSERQDSSIKALGYIFWKDRVILEIKTQHANCLVESIIEQFLLWRRKDSNTIPVDTVTLRTCIDSLLAVDSGSHSTMLYEQEFQAPFLKSGAEFFAKEASEAMANNGVADFMDVARRRYEEEKELCARCLSLQYASASMRLFEQHWIVHFQEAIVDCFSGFLTDKNYASCTNAYDLLSLVDGGVGPLENALQKQISEQATALVRDEIVPHYRQARDYVEALVALRRQWMKLCEDVFHKSSGFVAAVDKAFISTINDASLTKTISAAHAPELLARYCDSLLRKPGKTAVLLTDAEIEQKLDAFVDVFNYVESKDVFQKLYSRLLAKRLISKLCASDDLEMAMISRLKSSTGFSYVHMLQRMFSDLAISNDLASSANCANLKPLILTQGVWPIVATRYTMSGPVPPEFANAIKPFEAFYSQKHDGRKLTWLHHLTKVDVRISCFSRPYDLQLSLMQFQVLKLVSEAEGLAVRAQSVLDAFEWTLRALSATVKPFLELKLFIQSTAILSPSSILSLNTSFKCARTKIKLVQLFGAASSAHDRDIADLDSPAAALDKKTDSGVYEYEVADAQREANQDRSHFIQAVIVRVMKAQKTSSLNQIIEQVLVQSQSRFIPSIPMIKKVAEGLIEKGFLERSASNRDLFMYIS